MQSFEDLKGLRMCGRCHKSVEDIFINPSCDHVICSSCLRPSPPQVCTVCKGQLVADHLALDRTFKALWRLHQNNVHQPNEIKSEEIGKLTGCPAYDNKKSSKAYNKRNAKGETVLHQYCMKGFAKKKGFDLQKLKAMIEDGANPNTHDAAGVTPMHEAIMYDDLEILKVLLDGGGRVNCYRVPPSTLLHVAVERYAWLEVTRDSLAHFIIKTLLDYGADVNAKDFKHRRPIDIAKNNSFICEMLTSYKPVPVTRNERFAPEMPLVILSCVTDKSDCESVKNFIQHFKIKSLPSKGGLRPEVTHVVVPQDPCEATFIVRQAILSGCFIVTMSWIEESMQQNRILPAVHYEVSKPMISNSVKGFVSRRSRISANELMPKLFASGQFHILSNNVQLISNEEKAQIVKLIELGGGTILSREPKSADTGEDTARLFHAQEGSMFEKCSVFILFKVEPPMRYNMPHMKHVPIQWLYDCIDTYSIVEW